jgi:hypothetical protein
MQTIRPFLLLFVVQIMVTTAVARVGTAPWGQYPQVLRLGDDILVRGYFDTAGAAKADDVALISRSTGMVQLMAGTSGTDSSGDFPEFTVDETGFYGGVEAPVDATAFAAVAGKSSYDGLSILGSNNGLVISDTMGLTSSKYRPKLFAVGTVGSTSLVSIGHAAGSLSANLEDVLIFGDFTNSGTKAEGGVSVQQTADTEKAATLNFTDIHSAGLIDPQPIDFGGDGEYFVALIPIDETTRAFGLFRVGGVDKGDAVEVVFALDLGVVAEKLIFAPISGSASYAAIAVVPGSNEHPVLQFKSTGLTQDKVLALDEAVIAETMDVVPHVDPSEPARLLVVDENANAYVFAWDLFNGNTALRDLGKSPEGTWLGAIGDPATGGFALLKGKAGRVSGIQTVGFAGGNSYNFTSTGSADFRRPAFTPGAAFGFIQAVAYDAEPFVTVGAQPLQVYQSGDWASTPTNPAASALSLEVETFDGSGSGLGTASSSGVGNLPSGGDLADVATNQWDPTISLWFGKIAGAALTPTVSIFPDSVNIQSQAFKPEVSVLPAGDIHYRYGGSGVWSPDADGILPAVVDDTVVEVYATSATGQPGPIATMQYVFADAAESRDSDGDGLPDALEAAIGSDPIDNDCDGDTIPDAVELYLDMQDGVFDNDINTNDSAAFSSLDIANAQALMGRGRAAFDLTIISQRVLDGYELGLDAYSQALGDLASEEVPPAGGLLLIQDATGAILAEGSDTLRGPLFQSPEVDLPAPNQYLTISTGETFDPAPWNRMYGGEPMRSDFDLSTEDWFNKRDLISAIGRIYRAPGQYAGRAPLSGAKEIWNGTEWAVNFAGSGLDAIHGIRAEVALRGGGDPAYLHLVLERENTGTGVTTAYVSEGRRLQAGSSNWQEVRYILDADNFTKTPSGSETFETVLQVVTGGSLIKRVGFILSDTPEVAIDGSGLPQGSTAHPGFYIDRIRPIGVPGSGQRLIAAVPTPDIDLSVVPYTQTGATLEDRLSNWLSDYESALGSISGGNVQLSVPSTVVALLFERLLNLRATLLLDDYNATYRYIAPSLLPAELSAFATANASSGEPEVNTQLSGFTLEELEYLRYPSYTESLAVDTDVGYALDPQSLLADLDSRIQDAFDPAGLEPLAQVALGVYQVAASFGSTNPGALGSPVQALRAIMDGGYAGLPDPITADDGTEVAFRWKTALANIGIDETLIDDAQQGATDITNAVASSVRTLRAATVTVGTGLGDLTDAGAFTYELVDRDGNPFPLPEDFYFPSGSELSISGYQRSQTGSHFVLEVTDMQVLSLPRTTPTDSDGNLLDDTWELAFLGTVGADPYADPDGDGLNNLSEFIGGTDPNRQPTAYSGGSIPNPVAWPTPLRIERQSSGDFWIILPMPLSQADEFNWIVEVSNDLQTFAAESSIVESNGTSEQLFVIPAGAFTKAFWRLKAELQ